TGGASGIGRACAEALAAQGARVVVADLRAPEPVPAGMEVVQADLTTRAGCRAAVEETVRRAGGLDILVNNAGRQHLDPIAEFPEAVWDELVALMLTAPFLLTKYAWPHLERSGRGRVINVASVHALVASPYKAAYVSAKHGLLGLTRVAALEGGEAGITVNA